MAMRHASILFLAILAVHGRDLWTAVGAMRRAPAAAPAATAEAGHVILVVADGLRWQEVFRGADAAILAGDVSLGADGSPTRVKYWRPTVEERRAALMPFLWSTIAREGTLMGNRDAGGRVDVTNPMKFSYPGYNELLVGWPDAQIDRNDFGPNPNVTVFEWLNRRELKGRVAAFGMWDTFRDIFNVERSHLPVADFDTDSETNHAALRYLEEHSPRALFVGFGATDDLAHKGRYDMVLAAAHAIDGYLSMLWNEAQSSPAYRGRTTLIVVADHGRGRTPKDWMHHNDKIPGSDETWFAMIGPGVAARGELRSRATLSQTAATVAAAVGQDYPADVRRAAPPLLGVPALSRALVRR
jgi:hypothetical protein